MDRIVFEGDNGAPQSAAGRNLVPGFELIEHTLPFFLAALLRKNQKEVENGKNEDQWGNAEPPHTAATSLHRQKRLHVLRSEADISAK
jgi:hypothetical protein